MGRKPAKSYMPLLRQQKLQNSLQELGELLDSPKLADGVLAKMLSLPESELLELKDALETIMAYQSEKASLPVRSADKWTSYLHGTYHGEPAESEAAVV